MVFQEKIPPPTIPLTEEQKKLELEAKASEDLWIKNFIDRLVGVVRNVKP